jgi:hypothetical protein
MSVPGSRGWPACPTSADAGGACSQSPPTCSAKPPATCQRSRPWLELIRGLGIPVALVAQNGADAHEPTWDNAERGDVSSSEAPGVPAMLLGRADPTDRRASCPSCASTLSEWKLSAAAKLCVDEARLMGKWVHVARVNSWRRLDLMASWDVDSVDGTFLFAPDANGPPGHVAAPTPHLAAPVVSQLTPLPIEEVSAGTVRHGGADATPSSSGQEGVDNATQA